MNNNILNKKIIELINQASSILIICHQKPDGDALGSICAFINCFERVGKKYKAFCSGRISSSFKFLPGIEKISTDPNLLKLEEHDLIIVLDCGDLHQTGLKEDIESLLAKRTGESLYPIIINIDHHLTNEYFGDINLVVQSSSSTAEIVYKNFKDFLGINPDTATALFLGIFTDTGNFSNPATTISSFEVAASLLASGARARMVVNNVLKNKSLVNLKIWGKILKEMIENKRLGMAVALVSHKNFNEHFNEETLEGFTNFLNNLAGTKAVLVLREKEGEIKGSFRTTLNSVDVARLAKLFGGGGHQRAAGFTIKGYLEKTAQGWKVK